VNLNLEYIGSEYSYNWLLILALFSVLQWFITLYIIYSNSSIKLHIVEDIQEKHPGYDRYLSFLSDNFYWFWNIFPIIYFVHFFYIEASWETWMQSLFILDVDSQIKELYEQFFYSQLSKNVDISILIILIIPSLIFGYFGQDKKHKKMIEEKTSLYWWSKTLNSKIYFLRKIFLVSNLLLIGFLTYLISKISIFITMLLNIPELNIFPFHLDGYGGLHPIMQVTAILLSMYLLRASMGLIGLDDHKGQGFSHKVGDILNIIYLPIGVALMYLIYSSIKNHLAIASEKYEISKYLSSEIYQKFLDNFKGASDKAEALSPFFDYYSILAYNSFPIDIGLFYNTAFTAVLPISIWFLVKSYQDKATT